MKQGNLIPGSLFTVLSITVEIFEWSLRGSWRAGSLRNDPRCDTDCGPAVGTASARAMESVGWTGSAQPETSMAFSGRFCERHLPRCRFFHLGKRGAWHSGSLPSSMPERMPAVPLPDTAWHQTS